MIETKIVAIYGMLSAILKSAGKSGDEQILDDILMAFKEVAQRALTRLNSLEGSE